jgi:hypothetical protein
MGVAGDFAEWDDEDAALYIVGRLALHDICEAGLR